MKLYVAHENEEQENTRNFATEKLNIENLKLFSNFYFYLGTTEIKLYDTEVFDKHIECHLDIKPIGESWKTVTQQNKKQKMSLSLLSKMSEETSLLQWKNKGVRYLDIQGETSRIDTDAIISKYLTKQSL